MEGIPEY
jgi:RNase H-fold protein (predicted Holliday junction resolvase)